MKNKGLVFLFGLLMVYLLSIIVSMAVAAERGVSGLPKCGAVKVEFFNGDTAPSTKELSLHFKVTNQWDQAITLDDIKLRYYFTNEGNKPLKLKCYDASTGKGNVSGTFENLPNAPGHVCLEVGFQEQAGRLLPGQSATIAATVTASGPQVFNQTNDNSFNAKATDYTPWKNVLGYYRGKCHWGYDVIRTVASLDMVIPGKFYTMNCYGNFGLEDYLKIGGATDEATLKAITDAISGQALRVVTENYGCTSFAAKNNLGQGIFGRNFDFYGGTTLLIFCHPPTGYSFVSGVHGQAAGYPPDIFTCASLYDKLPLVAAPYFIMDGMNEKGMCISMMRVDHGRTPPPAPDKVTIYQVALMLLVLNYARNLDEAIELINQYNMYFCGSANGNWDHFLISDAAGNSAILEYAGGKMMVIWPTNPWQLVTNYVVCENQPESPGDNRLEIAGPMLQNTNGILENEKTEGMNILKAVAGRSSATSSMMSTVWSEIFNQVSGDVYIAIDRDYENIMKYHLKMSD